MRRVQLVFQHFHGCPNGPVLLDRVREALIEFADSVNLAEILVENDEIAGQIGFLGSPTLLINGQDWYGAQPLADACLSCRFYPNGLPTVEEIKNV